MKDRNVPYACGDCATASNFGRRPCSCSLRMWGLRAAGDAVPDEYGMFPTHVGIARDRPLARTEGGDVPYACGDCAPMFQGHLGMRPCSLRMWGLRDFGNRPAAYRRMFPTHVGIARDALGRTCSLSDVPYACGDCAGGKAGIIQSNIMFPTHVGIARAGAGAGCRTTDVPYACGDCARWCRSRLPNNRCSLRMWGLREFG